MPASARTHVKVLGFASLCQSAGDVWTIALSSDGKRALSASDQHVVRLWDVTTGDELRRFEEQLVAFRTLHDDELQMLRAQLQELRDKLDADKAASANSETPPAPPPPAEPVVSRRDLLTGLVRKALPGHD